MTVFFHISIQIKAVILLFSLLGTHLVSVGCAVGEIANYSDWLAHSQNRQQHGSEHHHEDHGHSQHHTQPVDDGERSDNAEDEGCCDDDTTIFWSSMHAPMPQSEFSLAPIQFNFLYVAIYSSILQTDSDLEVFSDKRPSPNIKLGSHGIRILIQSFQI